ncbi:hypothetical protein RxyAA322_04110 [Rubrobacter xylanophilus]|uniref:Uncharacterized protein n=1 Tax=Rubrobacter xylanophilus TaxID=49319 RepID=A0A510HJP8_9ACTN|nr:hypothetical protein RxyAA322_04110 [Rubrobacter xylanophilus]
MRTNGSPPTTPAHGGMESPSSAGWSRRQGCGQLHLDSSVQRGRAHRFCFREGMEILAFHFSMTIQAPDPRTSYIRFSTAPRDSPVERVDVTHPTPRRLSIDDRFSDRSAKMPLCAG